MASATTRFARRARPCRLWMAAALAVLCACATDAEQAPSAAPAPAEEELAAGALLSGPQLDELVARVALYPDELLAIVLPASTNPLQIVAAQRFLEARKKNPKLQPKESWDTPIVALLNYPDVVAMMNDDLDWTQALGDAVVNQQADVMDAVQQVRARAQAAGNLKTNPQQTVTQAEDVIVIQSASPEVIYVPQYDPQVIYAPAPAPVVSYYPPAPCYWCPAATFGMGMMMGAATAWAFNWHGHGIGWGHGYGDIDIERNVNRGDVNIRGGDVNVSNKFQGGDKNRPNRPGNDWKPDRKPGERPGGGRPSRPGGGRPGGGQPGLGGGTRPAQRPAASGNRPSTLPAGGQRPAQRPGSERPSSGAFGGYERGRDSSASSQRGAASRGASSTRGSGSSMRGGGSSSLSGRSGSSFGGYQSGGSAARQGSRGSMSRSGGGGYGGRSMGGGRGGGGRGGGRR